MASSVIQYPVVNPIKGTVFEQLIYNLLRAWHRDALYEDNKKKQAYRHYLIRDWIRYCITSHHSNKSARRYTCEPLKETNFGYPEWLVDVERCCLVRYNRDKPQHYFALSYVWGFVDTARTIRRNLHELQKDHSLLGPNPVVELPKTIADSLYLAAQLGARYFWCDRLCIVQDDMASLDHQIPHMGEIFARAQCTIIAKVGDANSGLGKTSSFSDMGIWQTRGWTFQEQLFSIRTIAVNGIGTDWQCSPHNSPSRRGEHQYPRHLREQFPLAFWQVRPGSLRIGGFTYDPWPDLWFYGDLVQQFNQRSVTRPEDALRAFAGITSVLTRSFPGGFIQGIPEILFDQCLLWQVKGPLKRRRVPDPNTVVERPASWSWSGWEGSVDLTLWAGGDLGRRGLEVPLPKKVAVVPIVQWYTSAEPDTDRHHISASNRFLRWRDQGEQDHLPDGWARKSRPQTGTRFEHKSINGSIKGYSFTFPFPIHEFPYPPTPRGAVNYLHCRAKHAFMRLGTYKKLHVWYYNSTCYVAKLSPTTDWSWAGVLRMNTTDPWNFETWSPPDTVELIALSTGSDIIRSEVEADMFRFVDSPMIDEYVFHEENFAWKYTVKELKLDRVYKPGDVYEFYNVMWIEWDNGIAYRMAVGRVQKDIWERVAKEEIDVVLG